MNLLRGDVWWVELDPTKGSEIRKTRPCVVISTNLVNRRRLTVVVVPLSTSPTPHPPYTVPVSCQNAGVTAMVEHVRGVSKERFLNRIEAMDGFELRLIEDALRTLLEL